MILNLNFTAVAIAALVGTIITVFFAYFPKVRVWFASLVLETQALLKLGLMVVITLAMFGLSFIYPPPYDIQTVLGVIVALILSNQPVASLLPATRDVQEATLKRMTRFLHGQ
jgi:hypothetical protein